LTIVLNSGTTIINFLISFVIFATSLFYAIVNSDTDGFFPIQFILNLTPVEKEKEDNKDKEEVNAFGNYGQYIQDAIMSVFGASLKMAIFYGFYTYLTHTIFDIQIKYIPSLLAAITAVLPFIGCYWVSLPGILYLYFTKGSTLQSISLFICHVSPLFFVDTAIYSDVSQGHPYFTALSVAGGLYIFGLDGAIYGPLFFCFLLTFVRIYQEIVERQRMVSSRQRAVNNNSKNNQKMTAQRAQVEAVIKTIIRKITERCANLGHSLSEALVAFMVKAIVIDPTNGLSVERPLTDSDINELIDNSVKLLTDKKSCSLETVKMQVFFDMNYTSREEMLEEHGIVTNRRLTPMSREICDSKARTRNGYDSLYRKMVAYVILASGLGSPTDIVVVRETTAALQSVYPQTELANFVALQYHDKQTQLEELCHIVTGIRLFNKECNKGGSGIEDLPTILNESLPSTTKSIDDALADAQETSYKITTLLMKNSIDQPSEEQVQRRKLLLAVLYNRRQFEMYIRALMNDIILSARATEATIHDFTEKNGFSKKHCSVKNSRPNWSSLPFIHLYS